MATPQTTTQIPETLTQQQAIGLLVQGVQIAQQRGAYNLEEAELIAIAIRAFKPAEEQPAQQQAQQLQKLPNKFYKLLKITII